MKKDPPKPPSEVSPLKSPAADAPAGPLTLHLDMEKYLGQLEDWNIGEDQKRQFIATLWNLLRSFAEVGFEIHPVQQAQNACGQFSKTRSKPAITAPDALYSKDSKPTKMKKDFAAQGAPETKEIRS